MAFEFPTPTDAELVDPSNWMGVEDLSNILGIKPQSLYNLMFKGANLPTGYRRIGSQTVRFFRPEVAAWLRNEATTERKRAASDAPMRLRRGFGTAIAAAETAA